MAATAEKTAVKRRSSRLRFLRCFTAEDDEESCSTAFEGVAVIDANGGGVGRSSDRRQSSPVTSRQKKRFWIFSGVVGSVSPDSSRAKKHWRKKRRYAQLSESNNKFCRKQDNLYITNSNKDTETDTVESSSSSSSLSTNTMTSSEADLSSTPSTSSFSSSRSLGESRVCESKHKTTLDSAMCLLVVSLLAVIMWGKVCAIVCTSTWLCIMFGRPSSLEEHPKMSSASDAVESEAYKKKIVLGGFLHRNCKQHI